jgi:hypothetical protein
MLKFDLKNSKPDKSKLVKNLANGNILTPYLDRAFQDFDGPFTFEYSSKISDNAWHPSGDCIPTVTELWEKATGTSMHSPPSGQLRKTFMVGHYWHQLLQHLMVDVLKLVPIEAVERSGERAWGGAVNNSLTVPWAPYHWVHGSADICPLELKGWTGLVDFKTMSAQQFKQQQLPDWCADKYRCQLNIYMALFDVDKALILGVNKDSPHDFKEYQYVRDQPLIDAIFAKWKFVGELLDADERPTEEDDVEYELPL